MKVAVVALLLAVLIGAGVAVVYLGPGTRFSDDELKAFNFRPYPQPRDVGDFLLDDAAGGVFGPRRLHGRWSFMFFGFANCPDVCPLAMSVLGEAERMLVASGDEPFQGILVTVDPEQDTASVLLEYVRTFSDDFVGVTGSVPDIRTFARSFHAGFSKEPSEDSELGYTMNHSGRIAVVDPSGRHYGNVSSPFDATRLATLHRALNSRIPARD
ncbi:MAG: SCO family protein [Gammaproteobacteria bacterium]|nr:SCO family protein [Gammaproteobacteria bacterium]